MESTRKTDENGVTTSTNYMLDDVIEAFEKYRGNEDELIKELTIQKIHYGRRCMAQLLVKTTLLLDAFDYWKQLDKTLQDKITEMGGTPIEIVITEINNPKI